MIIKGDEIDQSQAEYRELCFVNKESTKGGADEILDQMRSLTGGGHANVFL